MTTSSKVCLAIHIGDLLAVVGMTYAWLSWHGPLWLRMAIGWGLVTTAISLAVGVNFIRGEMVRR